MSGETRRVSGEYVRALRWDEGGEPAQSCSEGTGEMHWWTEPHGKQSPSLCSRRSIISNSGTEQSLPSLGIRGQAGSSSGSGVEHAQVIPTRCLPGEQDCANPFPTASQRKYLHNSMPILFSPCKSNAKTIAFGGNILLEYVMYFQTISYLRDLTENLTKIHCTDKKGEVD